MRRRVAVAVAALSLLALAAVRGGGGGPALYDGLCTPPTYVKVGANPPPPSLAATLSAGDLASTFEEADDPNSPQAQVIVAAGSLVAPPGVATARLTITPVRPPAVAPGDGTVDGNVYDVEVIAGGRQLQVAPNHLVTIVLTATAIGGAQRQVEHFDGTRWTPLAKTVQSGCGSTYQANSTTLGMFALVAQASGSGSNGGGSGGGGSGGGSPVVIVIVVVLGVLAVGVGAVRISRQRGRRGTRRRR